MNIDPLPTDDTGPEVFFPKIRPIGFLFPAAATAMAPAMPAAANPTKLRRVTPFGSGCTCSCTWFTLKSVLVYFRVCYQTLTDFCESIIWCQFESYTGRARDLQHYRIGWKGSARNFDSAPSVIPPIESTLTALT